MPTMDYPEPSKPPTPAEYAVIVAVVAVLFIALGLAALVVAFRAPPANHELALDLEHRGLWSVGIGLGIAVLFWLSRRFRD